MTIVTDNQITLLCNGAEFFPALASAINEASDEIYLQTYIFEPDVTGRAIGNALKNAAQRGVEVNLLLDGYGSKDLAKSYIQELKSAGVNVAFYRPRISPWTLKRSRLHRMHRKVAVIDGYLGFVGGINIIDDYNTPDHIPPRIDYAVKITGPLLGDIRLSAVLLWRRTTKIFVKKINPAIVKKNEWSTQLASMSAAFLVRDNFKHRRDIEDAYLTAIHSAKSEVLIANAYFIPGPRFRHALFEAAKRGVRVRLLLQQKVEYLLVDIASHALYGAMLDNGIEIYEYHQSQMHSKVAVIDNKWSMVGSSNIDPFSLLMSLEANIWVDDYTFAQQLQRSIESAIQLSASKVDNNHWSQRPYHQRILSWAVYGLVRVLISLAAYGYDQTK
ncbi:MAG: cardiolipin synthase ClsB [Methylophilus sp.]|jgi:cardiolipin synthase